MSLLKRLIPVLIFAALVVAMAIGLTRDPSALPSAVIDTPLSEFTLPQLNEELPEISRADLLDRDMILLNVFGSWCGACEVEHPFLMTINHADVKLVGLNWRDTRADAREWLAEHGDPYATILFDEHSDLAIELGVTGAPETFLIGLDGMILAKHVGVMDAEVWDKSFLPLITATMQGAN